jgi:putative Holliday junction resolvase
MSNTPSNDNARSYLAFDIGLKRTGVAHGQSITNSAQTAGTLDVVRGRFDWHAVDRLLERWKPNAIVIGDPQTHDANLRKVINRFKSHIQQHHKLPIICIDERLTSAAANAELAGHSQQFKTDHRDQIAACLILETYLNSLEELKAK